MARGGVGRGFGSLLARGVLASLFAAIGTSPLAAASGVVVVEDASPPPPRHASGVTVREDIQRRVAVAGGNTEGVLVASLSWSTPDDLDLHVQVPTGAEISYRSRSAAGGELDVDMCVHGGRSKSCSERPVENVVFMESAPMGRYKVYVQNFNFHSNFLAEDKQVARMQEGRKAPSKEEKEMRLGRDRPVIFDLLVKVEGSFKLFRGLCTPRGKTHERSNVPVFEFDYTPHAVTEEGRVKAHFEASSFDPACEEYRKRLLELSGEGGSRPALGDGRGAGGGTQRLPGATGSGAETRSSASAAAARPPTVASHGQKSTKAAKRKQAQEAKRSAALSAVLGTTRDTLVSKPAKVLRELLSDFGETCKGCMEKGELVDRLLEVAGANPESSGARGEL